MVDRSGLGFAVSRPWWRSSWARAYSPAWILVARGALSIRVSSPMRAWFPIRTLPSAISTFLPISAASSIRVSAPTVAPASIFTRGPIFTFSPIFTDGWITALL